MAINLATCVEIWRPVRREKKNQVQSEGVEPRTAAYCVAGRPTTQFKTILMGFSSKPAASTSFFALDEPVAKM